MIGEILQHPLAAMTSWRIGGKAQRYYAAADIEGLKQYLNFLPIEIPVVWLGLGSNVLIRDGGIPGAVMCTRGLQQLYQQEDGDIFAQAGVTCAKLARFTSKLGFADAAFFAGIPGTVGGALAMNAGAFGGQTWEWVKEVILINRLGESQVRTPSEYDIAYRRVQGKQFFQAQEAFMGAVFHFPHRIDVNGVARIRELLRKRAQTQPIGTFNCGSVYRNPEGEYAARLIEACKLKGHRIGDAMISPKHANFIINCGQARSRDVEALMLLIESSVQQRFHIQLQAEVKILGEKEKGS